MGVKKFIGSSGGNAGMAMAVAAQVHFHMSISDQNMAPKEPKSSKDFVFSENGYASDNLYSQEYKTIHD